MAVQGCGLVLGIYFGITVQGCRLKTDGVNRGKRIGIAAEDYGLV